MAMQMDRMRHHRTGRLILISAAPCNSRSHCLFPLQGIPATTLLAVCHKTLRRRKA
jgi:hypothetical protein